MPVGRKEHPSVGRKACKEKIQAEVSSNRRWISCTPKVPLSPIFYDLSMIQPNFYDLRSLSRSQDNMKGPKLPFPFSNAEDTGSSLAVLASPDTNLKLCSTRDQPSTGQACQAQLCHSKMQNPSNPWLQVQHKGLRLCLHLIEKGWNPLESRNGKCLHRQEIIYQCNYSVIKASQKRQLLE